MEENLGKILVDGKIVDLDNTPIEELKKLNEKVEKEIQQIRSELNELLS